jgi:histone-lysine N-methyltransferase SUV420H
LAVGDLVVELQGSIVPLPDQWRDEMDIGEDFAMEAAGDEESEGESEGDEEEEAEDDGTALGASDGRPTKRGKKRKEPKGARRSDRTKRRDFSIMWSEKDKRYQLFLGPARFLNVRHTLDRG